MKTNVTITEESAIAISGGYERSGVYEFQTFVVVPSEAKYLEPILKRRGFMFCTTPGGYHFTESVTYHYRCEIFQQIEIRHEFNANCLADRS